MPKSQTKHVLDAAREALAKPFDFEEFLAKLVPKDKVSAARRVGVLETANPDGAILWKRLACTLMKLSVHAAKLVGQQTVQYYVSDGKYRMQVFALEDLQDGNFTAYCPDVLDEAVAAGLLTAPAQKDEGGYTVAASGEPLNVESLTGSSPNLAIHVKDMTGWNRKALRIMLAPQSSPAQVEAAELLCALAASHFVAVAPPATPARFAAKA